MPPVDLLDGSPAEMKAPLRVNRPIGASWLLLIFGILPFIIVRATGPRPVRGYAPLSIRNGELVLAWRRSQRLAVVGTGLLIVAGVFGVVFPRFVYVPIVDNRFNSLFFGLEFGAVLVLAGIVLFCALSFRRDPLRGHLEDSGRYVRLVGHPAARHAVDAVLQHPPPAPAAPPAPPSAPTPRGSSVDDLAKLAELYQQGFLSQSEFELKKAQILGSH